jgi:hypothetical protein
MEKLTRKIKHWQTMLKEKSQNCGTGTKCRHFSEYFTGQAANTTKIRMRKYSGNAEYVRYSH